MSQLIKMLPTPLKETKTPKVVPTDKFLNPRYLCERGNSSINVLNVQFTVIQIVAQFYETTVSTKLREKIPS